MTKLERVNKVYKWLFFKGVGANQQEMAKAMNVDSSYLSQVLNGKLTLTNKFSNLHPSTLCITPFCKHNLTYG